jgi:hypothetical protein
MVDGHLTGHLKQILDVIMKLQQESSVLNIHIFEISPRGMNSAQDQSNTFLVHGRSVP